MCFIFFFLDVVIKELGSGSYGSVYLCRENNSRQYFAIKRVSELKEGEEIGYEYEMNSDYLVKYFEKFVIGDYLYLVMFFFKNGNVRNLIEKQRRNLSNEVLNFFFYIT
jgi:serine/threonine protein kinase